MGRDAEIEAFTQWAETNPPDSDYPYSGRHPDDIGIDDLEKAFLSGIEWAIMNVET